MAQFTTSTAIGQREDLSDVISRIDPDETPVLTALKKSTKNAILFDWQVQELAAAAANAQGEGDTINSYNHTPTTRLQNQHQIAYKAFSVSDSMDAVDTAGRQRESAYQALLKGIELRRDIEFTLTNDQAKSTSGNRKAGTLSSFIANTSLGASPTKTGTFAADGSDLPVDDAATDTTPADGVADGWGTPRDLSVALIEDMMQAAYQDGGNPSLMVMAPFQKRQFSEATITSGGTSTVTNQVNMTATKAAAAVGSVSVYLSDFGQLETVVDRFMPAERVYLLDPEYAEYTTLPGRNFVKQDLAKEGDSTRGYVLSEFSMAVTAPKAHAAIYALTTS